jgi:putative oxidoreductase
MRPHSRSIGAGFPDVDVILDARAAARTRPQILGELVSWKSRLAISRVLVAMIFLLNGLAIISQALAAKELTEHGAPASLAPFLMLSARDLEVVAGLGLAFGIYPRLAAVALLAFLIPTTLLAHAFWR